MKKTFLLITVLLTTVMASAQIQLLKTITGDVLPAGTSVSSMYADNGLAVQYFVKIADDKRSATFYDAITLNEYKVVNFSIDVVQILCAFKYVWALEDKLYFLAITRGEGGNGMVLFDENGVSVQTVATRFEEIGLIPTMNGYLFFVCHSDKDIEYTRTSIDIYSVPGNGEPTTDIDKVISSAPSTNRKALRNGNVFVNTSEHIYTIGGQVMK